MPRKQVSFRSAAREKILRGATQLADAVRVTLGPRSKSVLIERKWGVPIVCNDGVTIAKEFDLQDAEENLGARMLRQAAEKTGEMVGDGTSTSTLLAHAIFADGVRNVVARHIAENSAADGGVIVARMLEGQGNYGYDAARKQFVDLAKAGILDPTKVVRVALENAVSVASVLLLNEATMTELPEPKTEVVPDAGLAA